VKNLILPIALLLLSISFASYTIVQWYSFPRKAQISTEPTPQVEAAQADIQITETPTPVQPSDRALKVAAFAFVRMSKIEKKFFKHKYGNENMSDNEYINTWALAMDGDAAQLAENEAAMEKQIAQEKRPIVNNSEPVYVQQPSTQQPVVIHDTSPQRLQTNCYSSNIGNSTYTNCY
jgi:hypothetical protein